MRAVAESPLLSDSARRLYAGNAEFGLVGDLPNTRCLA